MAAGLVMGKPGDTFSISADSALGRSSAITGTTARVTEFSEVSQITDWGEHEQAPHLFIQRKFIWPFVHVSVYPDICSFSGSSSDRLSMCVRLSRWNIMGMRG